MPCVGTDIPGVEPPDDDVETALRLRLTDGGDVGEANPRLGNRMHGDVPAVACQRDHYAVGAGLSDRGCRGVEPGGVGCGEGQGAEGLWIAQAAGSDASEVGEHMIAARR